MFSAACTLSRVRILFVLTMSTLVCVMTVPALSAVSDHDAVAALEATQAGFHLVQSKVAPAVVTISSVTQTSSSDTDPFGLSELFGMPQRQLTRRVSGSGVVIRPEGIILTNSHVVQGATKVTVQFSGSDKKLPAKVVQTDQRTDLAIVRITDKGTYPTAPLGDAKTVQVGDWAIAFGSPYGLQSTMTVGIISATGRKIEGPSGDFSFYDLIQTDASINHGNSGGPLVNIRGEVVGINFMIYSPGDDSGSIGIGFAIPINNSTKRIIDTLITGHAVERGRIGIAIDSLDDAMREQFGVRDGGVLIQNVLPGSAGDKAGLKAEDVITELNGVKITDTDQFIGLVEQIAPGTKVPVTVVRGKTVQHLTIVMGAESQSRTANADGFDAQKFGMSVMTLTPEIARRLNMPVNNGVLVTAVAQDSPAGDAGLGRGDVILRVGTTPVKTEDEFWTELSKAVVGAKYGVLLRIQSGDRSMTITLPLPLSEDNK
ncbi:MAG TPA: trypsin-like peptidase domain-containing protein [Armatimonadota bacterium]|nr:trypsin-like peptidase domain-containing protein [Armatimonadota bacterium]